MNENEKAMLAAAVAYTADDYDVDAHVPAAAALERLRAGNRIYVEALDHERDLSRTASVPSSASSPAPTPGWGPSTSS